MSEITPKSFLKLVNQSGLCEADALKAALDGLSRKQEGRPVSVEMLARHLIDAGLITEWHAKKLKSGKYRGFFLGKYKLLEHIGTGGMSTVYLAKHTLFDQLRAIKVLPRNRLSSKSYLERFYREGRAAASLNHGNIVRVYDIAEDGETHYLVMEYVEGRDVHAIVKADGPLSFDAAIDYSIQALTGLAHAHNNELVHRDIKPANLLVTSDHTVKVLDLGLALFREEDSSLTVMHNERVLGTADYLPPEQALNSHSVDRRSDIYSMGCTLYYMLTGRPPFHEGTIAQRIARHQSVKPESVQSLRPETPDELAAIVDKAIEKQAEDRFQDCNEMITALRRAAECLPRSRAMGAQPRSSQTVNPAPVSTAPTPVIPKEPEQRPVTPNRKKPPSKRSPASPPAAAKPVASARQTGDAKQGTLAKPEEANRPKAANKQGPLAKPGTDVKPGAAAKPGAATETVPADNAGVAAKAGVKAKPDSASVDPSPTGKVPASEPVAPPAEERSQKPVSRSQPKTSSTPVPKRPAAELSMILGKKPLVDPGSIQIRTGESGKTVEVAPADNKLRQFVAAERSKPRRSPVPQRSARSQWILAGVILGMVVALAAVVALAIVLTSSGDDDSDSSALRRAPAAMGIMNRPLERWHCSQESLKCLDPKDAFPSRLV